MFAVDFEEEEQLYDAPLYLDFWRTVNWPIADSSIAPDLAP